MNNTGLTESQPPQEKQPKKHPFEVFDAFFCINLPERTDRKEQTLKELEKSGLHKCTNWFSGFKYEGGHPLGGRAGCASSHRQIIQLAKDNNLNSVLIFEDDIDFIQDPLPIMAKCAEFLSQNPWDVFYLGQTTTSEVCEKPLEIVSDGVLRLRGGLTTHAIAYHKNFFDIFLNELPGPEGMINWLMKNQSIDYWLLHNIQNGPNDYKCYTTDPMLCTQKSSFSNVDNKFVSYRDNLIDSFWKERNKI